VRQGGEEGSAEEVRVRCNLCVTFNGTTELKDAVD
jgi:hypothetical protein